MTTMYSTLEQFVGNTPLVRLQRIPGQTSNVILAKLEGNNPAGSVKDRPALSMVLGAERRGEIKPGDTLIEATSGNTGIALAMAAAIRGYRMVLVMPEHLSIERRQTMAAFGAQFVLTAEKGGMELARDTAERMRDAGEGVILDQFSNPDNPLAHYTGTGPEIWRDTQGRITHFVATMGTTGTLMGCSRFLKEMNPAIQVVGVQPGRRRERSRHPQVAGGLPAEDLRQGARGPDHRGLAAGERGDGAAAGGRGGHLRGHLLGRRPGGGACRLSAEAQGCGHRPHRLRPRRPLPLDGRVSRLRNGVRTLQDGAAHVRTPSPAACRSSRPSASR